MSSGDPATRARILRAARELIEEQRGTGPSMAEVAKRAGTSRQALYLHFADRTALFLEVTRDADATARTPAEQRRVDEAPTARDALAEAVALQCRLKPRLHAVATALDTLRRADDAAGAAWEEREQARLTRCEHVTRRLAEEDALSAEWTPATAARLMWALTSQRVWEDLVLGQGWSADQYTRHVTDLLERALLR
ncbi:TetR/AcrR family transcriptional regulator [Sphaerisporangium aureirubrum]|uniref:TetR/AcrR family transcriptional regulator n=1 Tax=Sphaerisporangium aureirubrum TaxID=1544736 RepID=A0ABW1NEG3_9ACTN